MDNESSYSKRHKAYYQRHREKILARIRGNPKVLAYKKEYNARPEVRERERQQERERYKTPHGRRRFRKAWLKAQYGISIEDYERMFAEQDGRCAICRNLQTRLRENGEPFELHVDHDHQTGKNRQLLCDRCNITIGRVEESVEILQRMIEYLNRHKELKELNGNHQ